MVGFRSASEDQACLVGHQRKPRLIRRENVLPAHQLGAKYRCRSAPAADGRPPLTGSGTSRHLSSPYSRAYGDAVSRPRKRKPRPDIRIGGFRREQTCASPSESQCGGRISIVTRIANASKHVDRPWRLGGVPRRAAAAAAGAAATLRRVAHHVAPEAPLDRSHGRARIEFRSRHCRAQTNLPASAPAVR